MFITFQLACPLNILSTHGGVWTMGLSSTQGTSSITETKHVVFGPIVGQSEVM